MIISDVPGKITCPHCGREKYILALTSGNTFSAEIWSDSRRYYPMLHYPSSIQKCYHCSHYFFLEDAQCGMADVVTIDGLQKEIKWPSLFDWNVDHKEEQDKTPEMIEMEEIRNRINEDVSKNRFGELTYRELAEGEKELLQDGVSEKRRLEYLYAYLFAYNDAKYGRANVDLETVPEQFQKLFHDCAMALIECCGEDKVITAELWRELGNFDKSKELCQRLIAAGTDVEVVQQILERAEQKNTDAFILHFDED